jgi:cation-transporting ATPase F
MPPASTSAPSVGRKGSNQPYAEAAEALAVGAIPEDLPSVVRITLIIGVNRMASRHAIFRKPPAVDISGSAMVVWSEKTGTLVDNQMIVQVVVAGGLTYQVRCLDYSYHGHLLVAAGALVGTLPPALKRLLDCRLLCKDLCLRKQHGA